MSLGNEVVKENKDLVHYHQCGASELSIKITDPVKAREYMVAYRAKTADPNLPYCETGTLYTGPLKALGCGHVWKHDGHNASNFNAHDCPRCGEPNSFRLYGLDLEKLGVALDKVQEFPRAA